MDAQHPAPAGMDGYFGSAPAVDPQWAPPPQLQPNDPFALSQDATMSFESPSVYAPPAPDPVAPHVEPVAPPAVQPHLEQAGADLYAAPVAPPYVVEDFADPYTAAAQVAAPYLVPEAAPTYDTQSYAVAAPVVAVAPVVAAPMAPAVLPEAAAPVPAAPVVAAPMAPAVLPEAAAPVPAAPVAVAPALPTVPEQAGPGGEQVVRIGAEDTSEDSTFLADLLGYVLEVGASDLHLTTGAPPTVRMNGHLRAVENFPVMTPQVVQKTMYAILTQKQREKFEENLELDFAYSLPGKARFRVNVYKQRDSVGAAFRVIPYDIKQLEDLGVPPAVANFAMLPRGFVLVTGPTGSGKSTTLAAVVDLANRQRRDHIMTCEDPIEFLHSHQGCLVNQREVGEDTWSFKNALKHVLRQDPDIILVGEMRDLETIEIALTAAETGHLVMATLHTQDAAQTIDRVIDVFPPSQQQQVRVMLSGALQGVVCQQLIKTADGKGRVVAAEVMVATPAIRNLIREGKTHQIYSALQAGAKHGMSTMDSNLADLVKRGRITYDAALEKCHHADDFNRLCGRA